MDESVSGPTARGPFPNPREVCGASPLLVNAALSVDLLLEAYRLGYYPKPENPTDIHWWCPNPRTVLFPSEFKASRSLRKSSRNRGYTLTINRAFATVLDRCARRNRTRYCTFWLPFADEETTHRLLHRLRKHQSYGRVALDCDEQRIRVEFKSRIARLEILGPEPTWITPLIIDAYWKLHRCGHAHSVETWYQGRLVGGLYGVSLGAMFFGESMFSEQTDASKVALYHLTEHLKDAGFDLIDCQEPTQLLKSLGARDISRDVYLDILERSVNRKMPDSVWETLPAT